MTKTWDSLMARVETHECVNRACSKLHFAYNLCVSRGMPPGCPDCNAPLMRIAQSTRNNMALFKWLQQEGRINADGSSTGREVLDGQSDAPYVSVRGSDRSLYPLYPVLAPTARE